MIGHMLVMTPFEPGAIVELSVLFKVKRLEMEKSHLEVLLETTKNQHKEEIKLLIESHE